MTRVRRLPDLLPPPRRRLALGLALLALGPLGCAAAPASQLAPAVGGLLDPAAPALVAASGRLRVHASDGRLLAELSPWLKTDIHHVDLNLSTQADPGTILHTLPIPGYAVDTPSVTLTNLFPNTSYRVVARAYLSAGSSQPIDAVSQDAASCTLDFATTQAATLAIGDIPLKLADKSYAGSTSSAFGLTEGLLLDRPGATTASHATFPAGLVTTLAGLGPSSPGFTDTASGPASFSQPHGLALGADDAFYVADYGNNAIRKIVIADGVPTVTTVAGLGPAGAGLVDSSSGNPPRLNGPNGVAVGPAGELYVADFLNHAIRKIVVSGGVATVSTVAGLGAASPGFVDTAGGAPRFKYPASVAMGPDHALYVADYGNNAIRKIAFSGGLPTVTTVAGLGPAGPGWVDSASGNPPRFNSPSGATVGPDGTIYVADSQNHALRKIVVSEGVATVSTVAGLGPAGPGWVDSASGNPPRFNAPAGVAVGRGGVVYVTDYFNHAVRKVVVSGPVPIVSTVAGQGPSGAGYVESAAGTPKLNVPYGVVAGPDGTLYVGEHGNNLIRHIR